MEKIESIEQVLESLDKNIVYKKKDSVVWGVLLILSGIVSMIIYSVIEWESNSLFAHILFVVGSVFTVVGVIKIFFRKSRYISAESHLKIKPSELYFHVNERDRLVRLLESEKLSEIKQVKPSIVDGLKLRFMATIDGQICYSQVVAYISSEYVNVTAARKHTAEEYQILADIVKSRK
jgi:hypothetical protein